MRRSNAVIAAAAALMLALAPGLAMARAGGGASMGSRGSMTYSAPPATSTAPYSAQPMQRSLTQPSAPSYGYGRPAPAYGQPGYAGNSRPFMSGLMGGLIGAGIGGLLFGGGLFHGISGIGGLIGFLSQIFLIVLIGRWLLRLVFRQPATASAGAGMFARSAPPPGAMPMGGGGAGPAALTIAPADYQAFEQLLKQVQAAWSTQDLPRLGGLATPEMVSYFSEQLSEQSSRGVRNTVTDVNLEKGDLAEAWSEGGRDYATVAMRFSMVDVTRDGSGRVVEGDPQLRTIATELWTFIRAHGGRWLLSAIQQTRG